MLRYSFILLFLILVNWGRAQEVTWAKSVTGPYYEYGVDSDFDSQGNMFWVGHGTGAYMTIDSTNYSANGDGDAFIAKLSPSNQLIWFKRLGADDNTYHDNGLDIHVDANDNVLVLVKACSDYFTYNGDTLGGIGSNGQYSGEGVLLKIDNDGNYLWHDDGSVSSSFQNVITDSLNNVYLTGWFSGSLTLGDSIELTNTTNGTTRDMFIARYDSNGVIQWAKNVGGTVHNSAAYGHNIALTDSMNQLVVLGRYTKTIYFDVDSLTTAVNYAMFLASYDTSGTELWKTSLFNNDYAYGQGLDISSDDVIGVAGFNSAASSPDGLVGFYDINGNVLSEETYLSTSYCRLHSLEFNHLNEAFITGTFYDTLVVGTTSNPLTITTSGNAYRSVIAKLSPSFVPIWAMDKSGSWENQITCKNNRIIYASRIDDEFIYNYGVDTVHSNSGDAVFAEITDTICSFDFLIDTVYACNSYTWIDGITYTSSNSSATDTFMNVMGCDSIRKLHLTIYNSDAVTDVIAACDSVVWIDGNTYTSSNNTATYTFTNVNGCDSVVTLNLTMNSPSTGIDVISACDAYQWIDGNTYTASNYSALDTLTNAAGCDSIVTLNLTITSSSSSTDTVIACDAYQWIDGVTYTASNSTALHVLTNVAGCDSVVTLNLTINNATTGADTVVACDAYQWINGNTYTTSNTSATYTLTNSVGCDSVVMLNLTVNQSSSATDTVTTCDPYLWVDGNTYTTSNNSATYVLTNAVGCDSVISLDLTIPEVNTNVTPNWQQTGLIAHAVSASYQWLDCDSNMQPIPGATNQYYINFNGANVAVQVMQDGCIDTSDCFTIASVGIDAFGHEVSVMAYPIPSSDYVNIAFEKTLPFVTLSIIDSRGGLVGKTTLRSVGETQMLLGQAPGVYYLIIDTGTEQRTISLMKE